MSKRKYNNDFTIQPDKFYIVSDDNDYLNLSTIQWLEEKILNNNNNNTIMEINVFRDCCKEKINKKLKTYRECPISSLWNLFHELFTLFSGLGYIKVNLTQAVLDEVKEIIHCVTHYALLESYTMKESFDPGLYNESKKSFTNRFRVQVRYMTSIIMNTVHVLETRVLSLTRIHSIMDIETDNKMKQAIKKSCAGDLNDIVFNVMEEIPKRVITNEHKILAMLKDYDITGLRLNSLDMPATEAFRILFPYYFDNVSTTFDVFYKECKYDMILFYSKDYLEFPLSIEIVPVIHHYVHDNKISTHLFTFIDINEMERREKEIPVLRKQIL